MRKEADVDRKDGYIADGIIDHGYEIYDAWNEQKASSRAIVSYVARVLYALKKGKDKKASYDAMSCLFALDMRIRERYNTFWKRLFLCFPRLREIKALDLLKAALNVQGVTSDVRATIEVALKKLREKLSGEKLEDGDDDTRGGKRNGRSEEEEAVATEEKESESLSEDNAEEITEDAEEKTHSEEKTETVSEQKLDHEQLSAPTEQQVTVEAQNGVAEVIADVAEPTAVVEEIKENAAPRQEEQTQEFKGENNGPEEKSKPSTNISGSEPRFYNDAGDTPVFQGDTPSEKKEEPEARHFIDEMIFDNIAKRGLDMTRQEAKSGNAEADSSNKDAHLYDKTLSGNRGAGLNGTKAQQGGTAAPETQNDDAASVDDEEADRVPVQVEMSEGHEHKPPVDMKQLLYERMVEAVYEDLADSMREQLTIASEEIGIEVPVNILGTPSSPPSIHTTLKSK